VPRPSSFTRSHKVSRCCETRYSTTSERCRTSPRWLSGNPEMLDGNSPLPAQAHCSMVPLMRYRSAGSGSPNVHRLWRQVIVALLTVSTIGTWAVPALGSHCDLHASAVHSAGKQANHATQPSATTTLTQGEQHHCPHCPPSECYQVTSCAVSSSVAVVQAGMSMANLQPHRVTLIPHREQHHSEPSQPPTPPPQLVA
jgi:hypothetical protein